MLGPTLDTREVTKVMMLMNWQFSSHYQAITRIWYTHIPFVSKAGTHCAVGYHTLHFLQTGKKNIIMPLLSKSLECEFSLHIRMKFTQGLHKWDCLLGKWLAGDCDGKGSHWGTNVQWGPEVPVGEGRLASKWPPVVTLSQGWWGALSWG